MGYQKCPVCNGTGKYTPPVGTIGDVGGRCHVCQGYGIINEATGEPPKKVPKYVSTVGTTTGEEITTDKLTELIKKIVQDKKDDKGGFWPINKERFTLERRPSDYIQKEYENLCASSIMSEAARQDFAEKLGEYAKNRRKDVESFGIWVTVPRNPLIRSPFHGYRCDPEGGQCVPAKGIDELS